jgi:hypothetical protein
MGFQAARNHVFDYKYVNKVISYEEGMNLARENEVGFLEARLHDKNSLDQPIIRVLDESF